MNAITSHKQSMRFHILLGASLALGTIAANAVGFRLPNQDPDAIARGNAFVATADNPSAIYYNPAGITQLEGQNVRAGLYLVTGGYEFDSPNGVKYKANSDFQPVPQLYYVFSPNDSPLSFGLGAYCPYGLSLDWGQNTPFWTVAEKGSVLYLSVNPVIAWKVHPTLSVAIGPTINYSQADFQQGLDPAPGFLPPGQLRLQGDGWAYGFNAGLRWQPHEKWAFGLSYRSPTSVDYKGTAEFSPSFYAGSSSSTTANIRFPQFAVAGISFRPTKDWNFEFDLDWADWDAVKQISIQNLPSITLNYKSSFMYEFGVTRQLGKGFFASLGYFYSENSSPDHDFTPAIPDTDLHLGSAGLGYKSKHFDCTVAYQFGYNPSREVTADVTYPSANGTYHVFNQAVNLAATFKF